MPDTELEVLTRIAKAFDDALDNALSTRDAALAELEDDAQRARAEVYLRDRFAARFTEQLFPPKRRAKAGANDTPQTTSVPRQQRQPKRVVGRKIIEPAPDTETGEPREAWGQ